MGNIEVIPEVLLLRDGVNDPLYLEDGLGNLGRVLLVFDEEKSQE